MFRKRTGIDLDEARRILQNIQPFARRTLSGDMPSSIPDRPKLSLEPVMTDGLNTLDSIAAIDALGDGPEKEVAKPTLGDMAVFSPEEVKAAIEHPRPDLEEEGKLVDPKEQQNAIDHATTVGFRGVPFKKEEVHVGQYGSVVAGRMTEGFGGYKNNMIAPRVSDFFIINTPMEPEAFMKLLNEEVLGNYNARETQGDAEFGVIVLKHVQGLPRAQNALDAMPRDASGFGQSPLAKVWPALIVKMDAGAWPWYDAAAAALVQGIVKATGREAWRCAWAIDKQWSWVEHWRYDRKTYGGKITETIDGETNGTVTAKALERWSIDVRAAFDNLMLVSQWETLRRWLLLPEPRPVPHSEFVSMLAGKLLIQSKDPEWIVAGWAEKFPGRKPGDGPLHLHRFYEMQREPKNRLKMGNDAMSLKTNPQLPGPRA